jgi:ABC-type transport system involved in cytochrome c biogenesis permease subunit
MFQDGFRGMSADKVIDALAWRFMLIAFGFHTLMLIAGAVWAQDAWGRYWAWDALETSSFLNWLLLGACLHARVTYKISYRLGAILILLIFIFAFFTYFGAPFYSQAAHKGIV